MKIETIKNEIRLSINTKEKLIDDALLNDI